jgi:hypothetical protein
MVRASNLQKGTGTMHKHPTRAAAIGLALLTLALSGCTQGASQAEQESNDPCAFGKPVACEHEHQLEGEAHESQRLKEEEANGSISHEEAESKAQEYLNEHPGG